MTEVEELQDDGGRAHVEGHAETTIANGVDVLVEPAHAAVGHRDGRIDLERRPLGRHEDPQVAPEDDELEVAPFRRPLHNRPAGETVAGPEERLLLVGRRKGVAAAQDLDDALVAAPRAPAGGRDDHRQLVGGVEQRPAGHERDVATAVDEIVGHVSRIVRPAIPERGAWPRAEGPNGPPRAADPATAARSAATARHGAARHGDRDGA